MPPANFGFRIAAYKEFFFDPKHKSQEQVSCAKSCLKSSMDGTNPCLRVQGWVSGADIALKDNSQVSVF